MRRKKLRGKMRMKVFPHSLRVLKNVKPVRVILSDKAVEASIAQYEEVGNQIAEIPDDYPLR